MTTTNNAATDASHLIRCTIWELGWAAPGSDALDVTRDDIADALERADRHIAAGTCGRRFPRFRKALVAYLAGDHETALAEIQAFGARF